MKQNVNNIVEQTGELISFSIHLVLSGSMAIALLSIALIMRTVAGNDLRQRIRRVGSWVTVFSACAAIPLAFLDLGTIPFLTVLIGLLLAPVV